jgi:sporulation protein YunB
MPILTVIFVLGIAALMILADLRLKASVLEIARSQAQLQTVELINQSVNDKIVAQTDYKDIIFIHKDENDKIVMLQSNTVMLNQIMAKTVNEVIRSMRALEGNKISIPLGQVTGSIFLAARGPRVSVKLIPAKQVNVEVENKFEQAGINQTRHLIYFKINGRVKIAVPFMDEDVEVSTTVPLADTIIVGEVPATYVNLSNPNQAVVPVPK